MKLQTKTILVKGISKKVTYTIEQLQKLYDQEICDVVITIGNDVYNLTVSSKLSKCGWNETFTYKIDSFTCSNVKQVLTYILNK